MAERDGKRCVAGRISASISHSHKHFHTLLHNRQWVRRLRRRYGIDDERDMTVDLDSDPSE
jgi:hypothetical protein